MRLRSVIIIFLFFVLASQAAAPTVSGFAVSCRRQSQGTTYGYQNFHFEWGVWGPVWRYDINNGVVTKRTIIFNENVRNATICPDGKYVAFVRGVASGHGYISYISASGGAAVDLVDTSVILNAEHFYLDWPTGDWIFYVRVMADGGAQIWKVNRVSKQNVMICKLKNLQDVIWQFSVSNDGDKAIVRLRGGSPDYSNPYSNIDHFSFSKNVAADGTLYLRDTTLKAFAGWYDAGCGAALSPDGAYQMRYINISHNTVQFARWDRTPVDTITYAEMAGWGAGFFGIGGNNPRWSSNDPKWICANVGWNDRAANTGSSQVLMNWVDHQIIRTSTDAADNNNNTAWHNDFGDFWVGNPPPVTTIKAPVTEAFALAGNVSISVFDMLGRKMSGNQSAPLTWEGATLKGIPLKQGVYFVQLRNAQGHSGNNLQTRKLIIQK